MLRRAASATKSKLGGQSVPRGNEWSSAEGEERFGARWNGLTSGSLVAPPVRHHGQAATDAKQRVLATPIGSAGSPVPLGKREGASSWARPNGPTLAQVCVPLRRKVLGRSPTPPSGDGDVGASRLARKHVSFRRLQKLDSGRHCPAATGEQSPVAAKAGLDQGGASRHDARPAGASSST